MSIDTSAADNQPIEITTYVVPYKKHDQWMHQMNPGAHVFIRNIERGHSYFNLRRPVNKYKHYLTVAQVNYILYLTSKERDGQYTVDQAADDWKYFGVNRTPQPEGYAYGSSYEQSLQNRMERDMVSRIREDGIAQNHWGNARPGQHLHFVFKMISTSKVNTYKLSPVDTQIVDFFGKDGITRIEYVPQIVAVRSSHRALPIDLLAYNEDGIPKIGRHVYVGMVVINRTGTNSDTTDENKYEKPNGDAVCNTSNMSETGSLDIIVLGF